mmetsp:Transcript_10623/g.26820  ORF Transcript_10623/g.26820 Transcript_10623/m.26820 type:complete len:280 (-) Transcript_10623:472-1311(-)
MGHQKDDCHDNIHNGNKVHDDPRGFFRGCSIALSQMVSDPNRRDHAGGGTQGSTPGNRHRAQSTGGGNGEFSQSPHQHRLRLRRKCLKQQCSNIGQRLLHEFLRPFLGVVFQRPARFGPGTQMVFLVDKHVKKVTDALHRSRYRQADGCSDESQTLPLKWTSKDKNPIQQSVNKQETNVVVHGRFGQSSCLKVEPHALIQSIRDGPKDVVPGIGSGHRADILRKSQFEQNRLDVKECHQTGEHGRRKPKHGLLEPDSCHFGIVTANGLRNQSIQNLVKG